MKTPSVETQNRRLRAELRDLKAKLQYADHLVLVRGIVMERLSKYMSVFASSLDEGPLRETIMMWSGELRGSGWRKHGEGIKGGGGSAPAGGAA